MASEIRVNRLSNRSGLSTITFANGGVQFSGITTFANGEFYVGTGATIINPGTNEFNFHTGGSNRFTINNSGANLGTGNITAVDATFTGNVSIGKTLTYEDVKNVDSVGVVTARTGVKITGGDFTVGTAITASSVTGNVTQDVGITTFSGSSVWFKGATANKDMYWSHASGATVYKDNAQILMGNSSDLQIYHNTSNSIIKDAGTGVLSLQTNGTGINMLRSNGDVIAQFLTGGSVELYEDGTKKFETTSSGVTVTGTVTADAITLGDSEPARFGASNDLTIQHNGSHSYIADTGTGDLRITGSAVHIQNAAQSQNMLKCFESGSVQVYHNNTKRFETTSSGAEVTGTLNITGDLHWDGDTDTTISNANTANWLRFTTGGTTVMDITDTHNVKLHDNRKLWIGASNDIQIYHASSDSTNYYFSPQGNVDHSFNVAASWTLGTTGADKRIQCPGSGTSTGVVLYNNGSERFRTTGNGAEVSGGGRFVIDGNATGGTARINMTRSDTSWGIHNETHLRIYSGNGNTETPSKLQFAMVRDGDTRLYYDDSIKFRTTASGIKVESTGNTPTINFTGASSNEVARIDGDAISGTTANMRFYTETGGSCTEKVRIGGATGSYLMVGTTSNRVTGSSFNYPTLGIQHTDNGYNSIGINQIRPNVAGILFKGYQQSSGNYYANYMVDSNNQLCGYVLVNSSNQTVSYTNSSDYRLKQDDVPITNGITRVKQLRPIRFKWKSDLSEQDGFFAHEVQAVVPEAVVGEKDAVMDTAEKAGPHTMDANVISPQQLDTRYMVPLLTAALKEAIAKIETLEAEVAALKSA